MEKISVKTLSSDQCTARAEALEECADHLGMEWADITVERQQGMIIADQLRKRATHFREVEDEREKSMELMSEQEGLDA